MGVYANLVETTKAMIDRAVIVPRLLSVVVILVFGWLVALIIKRGLTKVLKLLKLDIVSEKSGAAAILSKGEIKYTLSELIGVLVYWLAMLIVFTTAINAFGLEITAQLFDKVIMYIPNVVAALFIIVIGMFVAALLCGITTTAAANAGLKQAGFLGQLVRVIVIIFVSVTAIEQLGIATTVLNTAVIIILASIGLAAAIAFGLGAKDVAAKAISDWVEKSKK